MAARKRGAGAPPNETPEEKFVRLANKRTDRIIGNLEQLGKLGGKTYKSTPTQRTKIKEAIDEAVERMKAGLDAEPVQKSRFRL